MVVYWFIAKFLIKLLPGMGIFCKSFKGQVLLSCFLFVCQYSAVRTQSFTQFIEGRVNLQELELLTWMLRKLSFFIKIIDVLRLPLMPLHDLLRPEKCFI